MSGVKAWILWELACLRRGQLIDKDLSEVIGD
jgi:hypothetical protein